MEEQAVREYERALASLAPCAYARIFAASGSFHAAQDALEGALAASFTTFDDMRRLVGAAEAGRALVPIVAKLAAARIAAQEPLGPPSSFSRAPKLRAQEDVLALVRAFSEEERAALVLLHVEEVPDARVCEWLGVDDRFLEDLRARVAERAGTLAPPTAADAGGKELFERTLRQYRLSPSLPQSVMARFARGAPAASAVARPVVGAWIWPFGLLGLCIASASFSHTRGGHQLRRNEYNDYGAAMSMHFLASPLEVYILVVALLVLWRRPASTATPGSVQSLRAASLALATLGAPFVLMALSPMTAEMVATAFPGLEALMLAQNVWRLCSVACIGVGLHSIFLARGEPQS